MSHTHPMKTHFYIPLLAAFVLGLSSCAGGLNSIVGVLGGGPIDYYGDTLQEYDENGVPIYGYDGDNAVYGYDSNSQPIYDVSLLQQAVSVPSWEPQSGASVVYPVHAHRVAVPPPMVKHHHPLRHRHPMSPGPRPGHHLAGPGPRPNRFSMMGGPGLHPNRHGGLGPRPGFGHGPRPDHPGLGHGSGLRPDRPHPGFGPGPRPGRPSLGPGPRPGLGHGFGSHPNRSGMGHGPGPHPKMGPGNRPGPRPERKGSGTASPSAPGGIKIAPVPTAAVESAPGHFIC